MLRKLMLAMAICLPLSACQTLQSNETDKYSTKALQDNLKIGVTTSEEVRRIYGAPQSQNTGPDGPRLWIYGVDSNNNNALNSALGYLGVSSSYSTATTLSGQGESNRLLYIHFNNNRVSDYSVLK